MYSGSSPSNCLFHDLYIYYSRLAEGERACATAPVLHRRAHCCVAHDPPNATVNMPPIRSLSEYTIVARCWPASCTSAAYLEKNQFVSRHACTYLSTSAAARQHQQELQPLSSPDAGDGGPAETQRHAALEGGGRGGRMQPKKQERGRWRRRGCAPLALSGPPPDLRGGIPI